MYNLGVTFDSELTMQRHVNKVASVCFHHIRRLKQILHLLGPDLTAAHGGAELNLQDRKMKDKEISGGGKCRTGK